MHSSSSSSDSPRRLRHGNGLSRFRPVIIFLFFIALLSYYSLFGYEPFGSFLGTVNDPSGSVLQGPTVTITSKESGREYKTTTDNSGSYIFRSVEPGHYSFTFEETGFSRAEISDARAVVGQQFKVDM